MSERYRYPSDLRYTYTSTTGMENEFSFKKTMIILVIVIGCFAVLWPSVFYPMLVGSADQHMKPSAIDRTTGCCYVLSEKDVDTIKIMSELCANIIKNQVGGAPLTPKQIINICQDEVLKTCGIDISAVLQEQVRLGKTTKDILDQVRSLNGSLCLKYNFGVAPWRLGVPHVVTLRNTSDIGVPQERPPHLRSEIIHPALLEKGSAIPQAAPTPRPPKIIIEGRPPIPGSRPPLGAGAHGIRNPEPRSMGIVMPFYTVGIIIFFTYTIMKVIFRKHPDTDHIIYGTVQRQDRCGKDACRENSSRNSGSSCTLGWKERDAIVNAMSALLDEVDHEMEGRRLARESTVQDDHPTGTSNLSNGTIKKEEKPSVKVMAMETSESCEGGKKWQSVNSSVLPNVPSSVNEHVSPTQEIFLDRALPPQSQILVADSATETQNNSGDDPAVVLAGKMTLSVISLENETLDIEKPQNTNENKRNDMEILENSKQMIEKEISNLIEEAVGNLEIKKLDILDKKEIKVDETAGIESVADANEKITDEIDILLKSPVENTILPKIGTAGENEKLKDEIATGHDERKILDIEQSKISSVESTEKDNTSEINVLCDSEDCSIGNSRKDETSKKEPQTKLPEVDLKSNVDNSMNVQSKINDNGKELATSKLSDIHQIDTSNETKMLPTELASGGQHLKEVKEDLMNDVSKIICDEPSIEARKSVPVLSGKSTSEPGEGFNISHTSLAKSSSEESESTVHTVSNPGSVVNVSTKYEKKPEEGVDVSEDEESEEESEEEIEISEEEEEEIEENELNREHNERFNTQGNALLINGNVKNDEVEEIDEDEEVEEIIEEYSEEEEELEDDEGINDMSHLSSNGNRDE